MSYLGNPLVTSAFVTDQYNGTGSQTAFTMSVAPANTASILVAVSGVLQDPTTYSVNGLTLTFSSAPPSGTANISVRYLGIPAAGIVNTAYRTVTEFTATANQKTFTIPSYTVNSINVFKNGVRLGAADYTATDGVTVTLIIGAASGDLITTESFYVSSVLNAIPAVAGAVTDTYLNTGAVTQAKIASGVGGTGPAFSAYSSANQSPLTSATYVKAAFNVETIDTNNNYDTTNYRFLPTVAGYYQVNVSFYMNGTGLNGQANIFKNGAIFHGSQYSTASTTTLIVGMSTILYMNGTTDYIEGYVYGSTSSGTWNIQGSSTYTFFNGALVRAA